MHWLICIKRSFFSSLDPFQHHALDTFLLFGFVYSIILISRIPPLLNFKQLKKQLNATSSLFLFILVYFQQHLKVCLVFSCMRNSNWLYSNCLYRLCALWCMPQTVSPNLDDLVTNGCNEGRQRWIQPRSVLCFEGLLTPATLQSDTLNKKIMDSQTRIDQSLLTLATLKIDTLKIMHSQTRLDQSLLTLATLKIETLKIIDSQIRFIVILFFRTSIDFCIWNLHHYKYLS